MHRAQCDAVRPATFESFQLCGERLRLGLDPNGLLSKLILGRCRQQCRRCGNDAFSMSRQLLRCEGRRDTPFCYPLEYVAELAEGVDRHARSEDREAADPEKREQ